MTGTSVSVTDAPDAATLHAIAGKMRQLVDRQKRHLRDEVVSAGRLLLEAIRLGAFSDIEFLDLRADIKNAKKGGGPYVVFWVACKWFHANLDQLFPHPTPEFYGGDPLYRNLDWNYEFADTNIPAMADLIEIENGVERTTQESNTYVSASEVVRQCGVPRDKQNAAIKTLHRWRQTNPGSDDWVEKETPRKNDPRYLFHLPKMRDVIKKYMI